MTPIEIMALIVAIAVLVKILIIAVSPKTWFNNVTKRSWANPTKTTIVALLWTAVTLFFLLKELTIIQIFAVMLFAMGLIMLGFAPYGKDMLILEQSMFKNLKAGWIAGIAWVVLSILVLYVLFV